MLTCPPTEMLILLLACSQSTWNWGEATVANRDKDRALNFMAVFCDFKGKKEKDVVLKEASRQNIICIERASMIIRETEKDTIQTLFCAEHWLFLEARVSSLL